MGQAHSGPYATESVPDFAIFREVAVGVGSSPGVSGISRHRRTETWKSCWNPGWRWIIVLLMPQSLRGLVYLAGGCLCFSAFLVGSDWSDGYLIQYLTHAPAPGEVG